jgi:hypothetical protein
MCRQKRTAVIYKNRACKDSNDEAKASVSSPTFSKQQAQRQPEIDSLLLELKKWITTRLYYDLAMKWN